MKLTILSPERRLLDQVEVEWVMLPGSEGQVQILPGHAAMIGTLHTGIISYQESKGGEHSGVVSSGFFEVTDDLVTVTAETLELKGEINVNRAKAAQAKAEAALQDADLDEHKFKKYQLKLQRAVIRQHFATQ